MYHKSSLRKVNAHTGEVLLSYRFPNEIFAEGLTIVDDLIYVLTWTNYRIYIFDLNTLSLIHIMFNSKKGWGLTYDGYNLITTDGTEKMYFLEKPINSTMKNPKNTIEDHVIHVTNKRTAAKISQLNELEFINGSIYSNVWYEDYIVRIDPMTGRGLDIDMRHVYPKIKRSKTDDCLNGIAYDPIENVMIVTGKYWPRYYRLRMPTHHHRYHEGLRHLA
jgi:glutaminyl-peptide cyclotransferase